MAIKGDNGLIFMFVFTVVVSKQEKKEWIPSIMKPSMTVRA